MLPAHARRSPPSESSSSGGLLLAGEVGGSETCERHPERGVLDDPSAKVEVERLDPLRTAHRARGGNCEAGP
jgi:hypothetical protein